MDIIVDIAIRVNCQPYQVDTLLEQINTLSPVTNLVVSPEKTLITFDYQQVIPFVAQTTS